MPDWVAPLTWTFRYVGEVTIPEEVRALMHEGDQLSLLTTEAGKTWSINGEAVFTVPP
jgi:hypothetical protein